MRMSMLRVAMLSLIAAASVAVSADGPFRSVVIKNNFAATYSAKCPVILRLTATVNYTMPHLKGFTYSYHWERSDGAKGPVKNVKPVATALAVKLGDTWQIGVSGVYSETLYLGSGNTHVTQASTPVNIKCR